MISEKTTRLSLVVVSFMSVLFSCNIASHKNFTAYRQKPITESSVKLKIKGIFFRKPYREHHDQSPPIYFYLLSDGSLIQENAEGSSRGDEFKFWNDPEYYLTNFKLPKFGTEGHYFIKDSIITMQFYETNPGGFIAYNTIELVGKIKNDTTVSLIKGNCDWCASSWLRYNGNGTADFSNVEYVLHKTDIFPDTTDIWFKRKRWYKKKVWNADSGK
jgi:hypothetical protein